MGRYSELARRHLFDVVIVLGATGGVLEAVLRRNADDAPTSALWLVVLVQLVLTLPLLGRRRLPFALPVGMLIFGGSISFVDGRLVPFTFFSFLSVLTICFLFGMRPDVRQALAGLAITLAAGTIVNRNFPDASAEDYIFVPFVFSLVWVAGLALGRRLTQAREAEERARRAELAREEEARRAAAEERGRISRELHDVIAHSVSVMTVQAGAVRRLLRPDQERERVALEAVEETGRQALTEIRRLVGLLREQGEVADLAPQPSLKALENLLGTVREAGLLVELEVEGKPRELPPGVDLSAYRLVQEALTNVLRHAGPARAWVVLRWRDDELELEVANDGGSEGNGSIDSGHGLVGMQERIALYGGELETGPRKGGGFRVLARLPLKVLR